MKKRHVVIIGNSGAARECHWLLGEVAQREPDLAFKGFLAFEGYAGDLRGLSHLQMGNDDDYAAAPGDVFAIGIGLPALRQKAFDKWKQRGAAFINLIHPSVTVLPEAQMGEANTINSGSFLSWGTIIGNANHLNGGITLGHDVVVGDANFFAPDALVLGEVRIGSRNSFGVRSTVLAKARIGNDNTIAPGAFIYKGCRDNAIMAGNPACDISGS
jgi:sugar O-acyltransferase (sialic acid O-acetyltransferase NeuD family)